MRTMHIGAVTARVHQVTKVERVSAQPRASLTALAMGRGRGMQVRAFTEPLGISPDDGKPGCRPTTMSMNELHCSPLAFALSESQLDSYTKRNALLLLHE